MNERSSPLVMRINIRTGPIFSAARLKSRAALELLSAFSIGTLNIFGRRADVLKVINSLCSPSPAESLILKVLDEKYHVDL